MKKLIELFDNYSLRILVILLIAFIPLYPKLPLIDIQHTWVYIRVEDFLIAVTSLIFVILLLRKKVRLFLPLQIPIAVYWAVGLISLLFSIFILSSQLSNFFPTVAILSFLRRIEYMLLFFIGLASVRNKKDLTIYALTLIATNTFLVLYGFGQRFYIELWAAFPKFFEKYQFCFPSFQTTNEEFAKGLPLCLPKEGRITALFGGHYDLAAYLVLVIPVIFSLSVAFRGTVKKVLIFILGLLLVLLLVYTASRISFAAYLVGVISAMFFMKKKLLIIPILIMSISFLFLSKSDVLERFKQTIRFTNLIVDEQGRIVGESLSEDLKNKLEKDKQILEGQFQELPTGTVYTAIPGQQTATSSAVIKTDINNQDKYRYGAIQISTVSGSLSIQRALVYDISLTTRTQAEWPYAWKAFLRNPLFGSGYSSITLATDNSLLRSLGETGALGFASFLSFFLMWFIFLKGKTADSDKLSRYFSLGLAGGIVGLFANAVLIDVFEASKVAESMWLLLGIASGGVLLTSKKEVPYMNRLKNILTSHFFLLLYLFIVFFMFFSRSFDNYFIGDDFTWLRWSANSTAGDLASNFIDAKNFFYRPIDKAFFFGLYTFMTFIPSGYYVVLTLVNFAVSTVVYFILYTLFKRKDLALFGAFLFSFLPAHHQNTYWISTLSVTLSTFFVLSGTLSYMLFRTLKNVVLYVVSILLFLLAVLSYEGAVAFIFLLPTIDIFYRTFTLRTLLLYIPFVGIELLYMYLRDMSNAAGFSGDYNYNKQKLIPNFIGNFIGYILLFLFGVGSLSLSGMLRETSRDYSVILAVAGGIVLLLIAYTAIRSRKRLLHYINDYKIELFGLAFAFGALTPFLGLGNLSERYIYLASVGFVIVVMGLLTRLTRKLPQKYSALVLVLIAVVIGAWFYNEHKRIESHWQTSSQITYGTLAKLRLDYNELPKNSTLYFVNVPIQYGNAYIFPVGLEDGVWFVYRDSTLTIHKMKTIEEAQKHMSQNSALGATHIFYYNDKYELLEYK